MSRARRKHSLVFRAKVALEAMRGKSRWPPGSRSTPTKFKLGRRPWPMERPPSSTTALVLNRTRGELRRLWETSNEDGPFPDTNERY